MGKRMFDLAVAAVALVVTAPLWPVIAGAIKLGSKGPVLHRGVRVGLDGRPFVLYKFRSMETHQGASGPKITRSGDPRITTAGRWLRRSKLDELPNLLNVLRGDMSLVGPRPEDPRYVDRYTDRQRRVLAVRPGMTSPATVTYRHEELMLLASGGSDLEDLYLRDVLPRKLDLDLAYVEGRSFLGDLGVLWATFAALFAEPRLSGQPAPDH